MQRKGRKQRLTKGWLTRISKDSFFEGGNHVGSFSRLNSVDMGYGSYMGSRCNFINTKIGRYTSIASNVRLITGQHPTEKFVSTHPAFYTNSHVNAISHVNSVKYREQKYVNIEAGVQLYIGNDVWIGDSVKLMEGVQVSDGAIIAAGAMVVKDVPPYAIVGGVPARVIRYRFSDDIIKILLRIKWWSWNIKVIADSAELFEDVTYFISSLKERGQL